MGILYLLFLAGAVIGLIIAVLRRRWTWRTIDQDRAMRRLAGLVLAMWTAILLGLSVYHLVDPDGGSRVWPLVGLFGGVVGVATVWRAYRIQQEFYSDPSRRPEIR